MNRIPPSTISIRQFAPPDVPQTSALHLRALLDDFVTRFGERFLALYHLIFGTTPHATVVVASYYTTGQTVGALLGTLDTPAHYGWLVRHHGAGLAVRAPSVCDTGHGSHRTISRHPPSCIVPNRPRRSWEARGVRLDGNDERTRPCVKTNVISVIDPLLSQRSPPRHGS